MSRDMASRCMTCSCGPCVFAGSPKCGELSGLKDREAFWLEAGKLLVTPIEQLLQLVELQVRQQDLSLDVVHHLKRDISTMIKCLCNRIDSHCYPLTLPFDVAL